MTTTLTKQDLLDISDTAQFEKVATQVDPTIVLYADDVKRIRKSAARGAKKLDKAEPGWFKPGRIALSRFDIQYCEVCVLGQVFARKTAEAAAQVDHGRYVDTGWDAGRVLLFGSDGLDSDERIQEYGFDTVDVRSSKGEFSSQDRHTMAYAVLQNAWEDEIRSRRAAS